MRKLKKKRKSLNICHSKGVDKNLIEIAKGLNLTFAEYVFWIEDLLKIKKKEWF